MEVLSEHLDQCLVRGLEVMTETLGLGSGETELTRMGEEQLFIETVELLRCRREDTFGLLHRRDVAAGERPAFIHDECEQTREVTVLDGWHERAVLAERTSEQHGELRAGYNRRLATTRTGDRFVLGGFAQGGVVVRRR